MHARNWGREAVEGQVKKMTGKMNERLPVGTRKHAGSVAGYDCFLRSVLGNIRWRNNRISRLLLFGRFAGVLQSDCSCAPADGRLWPLGCVSTEEKDQSVNRRVDSDDSAEVSGVIIERVVSEMHSVEDIAGLGSRQLRLLLFVCRLISDGVESDGKLVTGLQRCL